MLVTIIIWSVILLFCFQAFIEFLNLKCITIELPSEFKDIYSPDKYEKSQKYLKECTILKIVRGLVLTFLIVFFLKFRVYIYIETFVVNITTNSVMQGVTFFLILYLLSSFFSLPFSFYSNFGIENKYGFNKMTKRIFFMDFLKSIGLGIILGGVILFFVLFFFEIAGNTAWLWCLLGITLFELFIIYISPVLIMPLFYKFVLLRDGELKTAVTEYAESQKYKIKGVFSIDASKRTTKANAFFAGFGANKRIGLFDTLIANFTVPEIVAVLAHEIGHYKKKHMLKGFVLSVINSAIMLFLLQLFISSNFIHNLIGRENLPIYTSILLFSFIFMPLNYLFSVISNYYSRRYEFQADNYVVTTTDKSYDLISALKRLSVDSLSNLTPHPLKVFIEYTHPPVIQRIKNLKNKTYR